MSASETLKAKLSEFHYGEKRWLNSVLIPMIEELEQELKDLSIPPVYPNAFVEDLIKERDKLKSEFETRVACVENWQSLYNEVKKERDLLETVFSELGIAFNDLKREKDSLEKQIIGLKELNHGLDYCAEQEEIKRKSAEAEVKTLKEKYAKFEAGTIREIDDFDTPLGEVPSESEMMIERLKQENTGLFNDYESRIYAVTQVLKDICHHVDKDCFATCKGDYSGTSCLTYRIWDALFPTALIIANQTRLNGGHNSLESSILQPLSEENVDLKVRLVKVQELIEKWQHDMPVGSGMPTLSMREIYFRCIHELEALLK